MTMQFDDRGRWLEVAFSGSKAGGAAVDGLRRIVRALDATGRRQSGRYGIDGKER
jgi:hypothetical protein